MSKILKNKKLLFLIIVLAVSSFFRLWQITSLPGGLFPDEAANGLDIVNYIFQGHHSPFFERGLGREALFFYLQAVSVFLFGTGVWQLHLVSALIGILTVVATWFLAKNLFNERVAFFTSFFLATSTWHTTLSRTGFRAILLPLLTTLFFYLVYLIFKEYSGKKRKLLAVLAGLILGLGFYTYISFRAIVAIIGLLTIIVIILHRGVFKKFWKEITLGLVSMTLVLIPLIIYFVHNPDSFMTRAGYISIFNPEFNQGNLLGTFLDVAKKTLLMFFTEGDLNWRHNVSGFSVLNPLVSPLFAFGFIYSIFIIFRRFLRRKVGQGDFSEDYFKYLFLVVWFLGMLGPELMSAQGIPHGLRAIGAMPAVFFFPAIMINEFLGKIKTFPKGSKVLLMFVLVFILLTSFFCDYFLYFGISANSPGFYYAYRSDLTTISNYLNERGKKDKTYLVLDEYSAQTPEFLTAKNNQPYILVDPATSYKTILQAGDQIVFTQSTIFDTIKFEEYHPEARLIKKEINKFNEAIMMVYEY